MNINKIEAIVFSIDKSKLVLEKLERMSSGGRNQYYASFSTLSADWEGLSLVAQFYKRGKAPVESVVFDGKFNIPDEVVTGEDFYLTIIGVGLETTKTVTAKLVSSTVGTMTIENIPTPSVWEQYILEVNEHVEETEKFAIKSEEFATEASNSADKAKESETNASDILTEVILEREKAEEASEHAQGSALKAESEADNAKSEADRAQQIADDFNFRDDVLKYNQNATSKTDDFNANAKTKTNALNKIVSDADASFDEKVQIATDKASEASQSATNAELSKQEAETAKQSAETAEENSREHEQTAKGYADNVAGAIGEHNVDDTAHMDIRNMVTNLDIYKDKIPDGAGSHNSIYRGKSLGTSVTSEQYANIANGTFKEMYIGDFWTINGTKYVIASFDYFYKCGDTALYDHHATLIPEDVMYNTQMNNTESGGYGPEGNTTEGGYIGSDMYTTNLERAKTTIAVAFGDHLLEHKQYLVNAVTSGIPSGGAWLASKVELMNEIMVYGTNVFSPASDGTTIPTVHTVCKTQLPLFALRPDAINFRESYWLRDVVSATSFARVSDTGGAYGSAASNPLGVRPAFSIS